MIIEDLVTITVYDGEGGNCMYSDYFPTQSVRDALGPARSSIARVAHGRQPPCHTPHRNGVTRFLKSARQAL